MQMINGKLVIEDRNQLDAIKQKTEEIAQRWQNLELQVTVINKQKDAQYLEEINAIKTYLLKIDQKLRTLENNTSNQSKELVAIKFFSVMGLASLWFWIGMNHQQSYHNIRLEKHAESIEMGINCEDSVTIAVLNDSRTQRNPVSLRNRVSDG